MKLFNKVSIFGLALLISCSAPVLAGKKSRDKRALNRLIKEQIQQGEASTEAIVEVAPEFNERAVARRLEHQLRKEQARQERAPLALEQVAPAIVAPEAQIIEHQAQITPEPIVLPLQPQSGWVSRLWTATKAQATAVATSVKSLANRAIDAVTPTFVEIPADFGNIGMIDQTSFPQQTVEQNESVEAFENQSDTSTVRSPSFDNLSDSDLEDGLEPVEEVIEQVTNSVDTEVPLVAHQTPLAIEYHPEMTQQSEANTIPRGVTTIAPEIVTLPQEAMDIVMEQLFPQPQPAPLAIEYHPELTAVQSDASLDYEADQSDVSSNDSESMTSSLYSPSLDDLSDSLSSFDLVNSSSSADFEETMSDGVLELPVRNNVAPRRHSIHAIPGHDVVNPEVALSQPQVIEDIPAVAVPVTQPTVQPVDQVIEEVVPAVNPTVVDIESQQPVVPAPQGWFSSLTSFATAQAKAAATYVNQHPAELAAILIGTAAAGKVAHTVYTKTAAQPALETVFSIPCKEGASLQLTNDGTLSYVGTTANALHKANVLKTDIVDAREGYIDLRTAQGSYFVRISKETVTETIENTVVEYAQYTFQLVKEEADGLWVYEDEGVELETTIKVDLANKTIVPVNEQEQAQRTRVVSLITKLAAAQPAPQEAVPASN